MSQKRFRYLILAAVVASSHWAGAEGATEGEDFKGSKDHSYIPRVKDSYIIGYQFDEFNDADLLLGPARELNGKWVPENTETIEGRRTRILYAAPKNRSTLEILRNYQQALAEVGQVEELFSCKSNSCGGEHFLRLFWTRDKYLPGSFRDYLWDMGYPPIKDDRYWIGKVTHSNGIAYVSLYVAINNEAKGGAREMGLDRPVALLDVLEVQAMESSMVFVKADEMASEIGKEGHIALYGINFDFDSDKLKPESDDSIKEIAALLTDNPALKLYVVGHTDNKGTIEYNLDLSRRRAHSVVKALASLYGINESRLFPFGAGVFAPVATNDTEEGRAKNRRVELVKW